MFRDRQQNTNRFARWLILILAILSVSSLLVTILCMSHVRRERAIVASIIQHLPASDLEVAEELESDLQFDNLLMMLLILNIMGTAVAAAFAVRNYLESEKSLSDFRVAATDILVSMGSGVATTDCDGKITSLNPSGLRLLGVNEDCYGQQFSAIDESHKQLDNASQRIIESEGEAVSVVKDFDYQVTQQGHQRTYRVGASVLRDRNNLTTGAVIHLRDVTERVLIDDRLRRMERYIGLGSLAAGLHHEIKNPLAALSLHVQLLEEEIEESSASDDVQQMFGVIKTEVNRIGGVLEGFRDFASSSRLHSDDVHLAELVKRQIELIRPRAEQQGIELIMESSLKNDLSIQADQVRLEQVLLNLMLNAIDAMPHGGKLTLELLQEGNILKLLVHDTGHGIPEDLKNSVFDPYFTTKGDGTGLGLALCDKIMQQHSGRLQFKSSTSGTTFEMHLPIQPSNEAT